MIMTFDFVIYAKRNSKFMKKIKDIIEEEVCIEVCTDIHRIRFNGNTKSASVFPLSSDSPFNWKVVPKEITYKALLCMLNDKWEEVSQEDIKDI